MYSSLRFIQEDIVPLLLLSNKEKIYIIETTAINHISKHIDYLTNNLLPDLALEKAYFFTGKIDNKFQAVEHGLKKFKNPDVDLLMGKWVYKYIRHILDNSNLEHYKNNLNCHSYKVYLTNVEHLKTLEEFTEEQPPIKFKRRGVLIRKKIMRQVN